MPTLHKWGLKYCAAELEIDHLPLHPARVRAADLHSRFYFVDEHSNFDSDSATQHAPHGDQLRLIALPMQTVSRLPILTKFVVCDPMKLAQGQRSCPPTFGGIYHRLPSLRIMQASESSQPTALPLRALPQVPPT